jgi:hypothetical protein
MNAFPEDLCTFMIVSHLVLPKMGNVSGENCRENWNVRFVYNNFSFFRISYRLWDNVEKYGIAGQATDDDMAHAHCMLDNQGYRHKLRICNTYWFYTATMVTGTHFSVTLYVHCLPFDTLTPCAAKLTVNVCNFFIQANVSTFCKKTLFFNIIKFKYVLEVQ